MFKERHGFDARDIYIWDTSGALLTAGQLDQIQRSSLQKVLLNARVWGKHGDRENEAAAKAAVTTPDRIQRGLWSTREDVGQADQAP